MRLSTKLFIGAVIVIFALTTVALFWGRSVVNKELDAVLAGANDVGTRVLDLESFKGLDVEGPFDIVLQPGKGEHRFTAPKVLLDRYNFYIREGNLDIRTTNPFLPKGVRLSLDLYIDELAYLNLNGPVKLSSAGAIENVSTLEIWTHGKSKAKLSLSGSNLLEAWLYNESSLELEGATGQLTLNTFNSAEADLLGLVANSVIVQTAQNSSAKVRGNLSMNLTAEKDSRISYLAGDTTEVKIHTEDDGVITRITEDSTQN